ncbi:MAG: immune inhibitor A [bacterium]|nr:immune inhibitor A [bacterium]
MRRPLSLLLAGLCLLVSLSALAAEPRHDLVRVSLADPAASEWLRLHQNELDVVFVKPGVEAHIAAQPGDEAILRAAGLVPEVMQRDMELAAAYPDKGVGFGIFHTFSENVAFMDSLRLLYPNVISAKWSIGTTYQGRSIWAYRLSDNPDVDENEPEVLIDGTHHAREIMAAEFPIMFAEYLCKNYATDPSIKWLVDNRELYLIPVVNPDGFVYNETTDPNGGGMWRKNRSPQAGGQIGVDLNRNYPNHWGYDDIGSSPSPSDITYRGPSAASELETQAMINFVNGREIITHDSVHTYSGMTLYPWGYINSPSPQDATFQHIAQKMTAVNNYDYGRPGAILYEVNGGVFDTFYGTTSFHPAIFSMSNEIGSYGFWPPESNRSIEFNENLDAHLYLMRAAGTSLTARSLVATGAVPGGNGTFNFTVENESVVSSALNVQVTVTTDDPWVQLLASSRTVGNVPAMGTATLGASPIPFTVDAACPSGHQVQLLVTVHQPDGDLEFPMAFLVGSPSLVFSDNFESGTGNWTLSGTWGTTTSTSHSTSRSLTDTPTGSYTNYSNTSAQLNGTRRISRLRFWHKYTTEATYDFAQVQVSANGGPWTTVAQYDGTLSTWTQVTIDLAAYAGQDLALRFYLTTDVSLTYDGWYIDDVELEGATPAFAMLPPVALSPVGGAVVSVQPALTVANSAVPGGGAADYGFRLYRDAACTDVAATVNNVAETAGQTAWITPTLAAGNYWWRAWAGNGVLRTSLTEPESFTVSSYVAGVDLGGALNLRVIGGAGSDGSRLLLTLPGRADVTVDIHDARGARVRRLFSGSLDGGERALAWDGRDTQGRSAASGVYFVRAQVGSEQLTGRVVIVR